MIGDRSADQIGKLRFIGHQDIGAFEQRIGQICHRCRIEDSDLPTGLGVLQKEGCSFHIGLQLGHSDVTPFNERIGLFYFCSSYGLIGSHIYQKHVPPFLIGDNDAGTGRNF